MSASGFMARLIARCALASGFALLVVMPLGVEVESTELARDSECGADPAEPLDAARPRRRDGGLRLVEAVLVMVVVALEMCGGRDAELVLDCLRARSAAMVDVRSSAGGPARAGGAGAEHGRCGMFVGCGGGYFGARRSSLCGRVRRSSRSASPQMVVG